MARNNPFNQLMNVFNLAIDKMVNVVVPKQKTFNQQPKRKRRTSTPTEDRTPTPTQRTPKTPKVRRKGKTNKAKVKQTTSNLPNITSSPYVKIGSDMIDTMTGEIIEEVGEYNPAPPQPTPQDKRGDFGDTILKNIRAKIDDEWGVFYYKPYTMHIPNANYFSGYLEALVDTYSEEEVADALERIGTDATSLASRIIYASKEQELVQRVDTFINMVYAKLGEEFDGVQSQYLQNMAEANWFN